jgi:RimJ/RimL family protein N-acetyltransferase
VLELAFAHLGAVRAVSEAWEDNVASLAVSWRLGYAENGVDLNRRDGGTGRMQRIRLDARDWLCPFPVTVTGLEPCLPLLGLTE